ncbi:Sulfate transporter 91 [Hibiscus syriacus]|uniref:Sulfate transporter 91 n=1 Tax=Hibiscus syriacus TaxID=106335 RepID=A0A6A3BKN4_HIBSY|nr:Sulfate transporter 91 [Hibiscus syriacus]
MEKGDRGKEHSRDRISELPDAILLMILSFLTIKETYIDTWFCFAISKRVRKLELDFEEVAEETWPPDPILPHFAKLEISAPNLRTFRYYGQKMALYIENAPVLADVLICGNLDDEPAFSFCPLSSYLGQLETLTLEMSAYNMMFPKFPELTKLRHLVVSAYGGYDDDLLVLTFLIDASPSLNKLSLELKIWRSSTYHHAHSSSSVTGKPIPSLKELEIVGFRGFKIDVNFVTRLYVTRIESTVRWPSSVIKEAEAGVLARFRGPQVQGWGLEGTLISNENFAGF